MAKRKRAGRLEGSNRGEVPAVVPISLAGRAVPRPGRQHRPRLARRVARRREGGRLHQGTDSLAGGRVPAGSGGESVAADPLRRSGAGGLRGGRVDRRALLGRDPLHRRAVEAGDLRGHGLQRRVGRHRPSSGTTRRSARSSGIGDRPSAAGSLTLSKGIEQVVLPFSTWLSRLLCHSVWQAAPTPTFGQSPAVRDSHPRHPSRWWNASLYTRTPSMKRGR